MVPKFRIIPEKKLIGKRLTMTLAESKMRELWSSFMPDRNQILNSISTDLISMVVYKQGHFASFHPSKEFERWAAMEVSNFENVPMGMESVVIPLGNYAVFEYIGLHSDPAPFQYIFGNWLPNSEYELDDRPHFEVLGPKYKNNDPKSEEEIWIPIRLKRINNLR